MKIRTIFILLIVSTFIFSCDKEETKNETQEEQTDNNTDELDFTEQEFDNFIAGENNKSWEASTFDLSGMAQDCRLDDSFFFNANKTYTYNGGEDLCGGEDQESRSGTWTVNAETNNIIFDEGTSSEFQAKIKEVSDTGIKLEGSYMMLSIEANFSTE